MRVYSIVEPELDGLVASVLDESIVESKLDGIGCP